jgi:hypothetical protein
MTRASTLVALVLVTGCGPTNMTDFCKQLAAHTCKKVFSCAGSSATSLYADEAACTEDWVMKTKCDLYNDYPCDIDGAKANACLSSVDKKIGRAHV